MIEKPLALLAPRFRFLRRGFCFGLAISVLSGCASVVPDAERPEPRQLGAGLPAYAAPQTLPSGALLHTMPADELRGTISLHDALTAALLRNPDLAAFSWEVRSREARALQAGLLPNPELAFEIENFGGTDDTVISEDFDKPVIIHRFPSAMKAFYMKINEDNPKVMNAADLLLPNVGEIIGASQREDNLQTLLAGYKRENLDPSPYYWYTDQRKYGTVPHSGFGLGLERLVQSLLKAIE